VSVCVCVCVCACVCVYVRLQVTLPVSACKHRRSGLHAAKGACQHSPQTLPPPPPLAHRFTHCLPSHPCPPARPHCSPPHPFPHDLHSGDRGQRRGAAATAALIPAAGAAHAAAPAPAALLPPAAAAAHARLRVRASGDAQQHRGSVACAGGAHTARWVGGGVGWGKGGWGCQGLERCGAWSGPCHALGQSQQ